MTIRNALTIIALTLGFAISSTASALTLELNKKTMVEQTTCEDTTEVPFAYLSAGEQRTLQYAVDVFNSGAEQADGCEIVESPVHASISCTYGGIQCWVGVDIDEEGVAHPTMGCQPANEC